VREAGQCQEAACQHGSSPETGVQERQRELIRISGLDIASEEVETFTTEKLPVGWIAPYQRDSERGFHHGTPLIGPTVRDVVTRVSIDSGYDDDPVFVRVLHEHSGAAQIQTALAACGLPNDDNYRVARAGSRRPVHDGFLTCLRFSRAAGETLTVTIGEVAAGFLAAERERVGWSVTDHVVKLYENAEPDVLNHPVLHLIDFPCFDMGSLGLGFGLMICRDVWLWSRCVYYHK
jgi:hypothetical protein